MSKRCTPNFFTCLAVYLPYKRVALRASSVFKIVKNENWLNLFCTLKKPEGQNV